MSTAPVRTLALVVVAAFALASQVSRAEQTAPNSASTSTELVFFVPSSGWIADSTFIALSKSSGSSAIARQLATILAGAERSPLQLAVVGKAERKTIQVIKDAFAQLEASDLSNLDFTFIGSPKA